MTLPTFKGIKKYLFDPKRRIAVAASFLVILLAVIILDQTSLLPLNIIKSRDFTSKTEGVNVKGKIGSKKFDTVQGILEFSRDSEFILNLHGEKGKVIYDGNPEEDQVRLITEETGVVEMIKMGNIQEGDYLVFLDVTKDEDDNFHSNQVIIHR